MVILISEHIIWRKVNNIFSIIVLFTVDFKSLIVYRIRKWISAFDGIIEEIVSNLTW